MNIHRANFETHKQSAEQTGRKVNEQLKHGTEIAGKAAIFVGTKISTTVASAAGTVYGFIRGTVGKASQVKRLTKD